MSLRVRSLQGLLLQVHAVRVIFPRGVGGARGEALPMLVRERLLMELSRLLCEHEVGAGAEPAAFEEPPSDDEAPEVEEDWRAFRARLVAGGIPTTTDADEPAPAAPPAKPQKPPAPAADVPGNMDRTAGDGKAAAEDAVNTKPADRV